jgi:plasmid stabilization system protein ParE
VVDWLDEATEESRESYRWYAERSIRAATGFVAELDRAVEAISENPERYPTHLHGTRRYLLRRYPYIVVYRVEAVRVVVVAVQHCKRQPGYWAGRI